MLQILFKNEIFSTQKTVQTNKSNHTKSTIYTMGCTSSLNTQRILVCIRNQNHLACTGANTTDDVCVLCSETRTKLQMD